MNIKIILPVCVVIILGILAYCCWGKRTPRNTLAVFEVGGKKVYLTDVSLLENEDLIGNGDFYLVYGYITGSYPARYSGSTIFLHAIPEGDIYRIESRLMTSNTYVRGKNAIHAWGRQEYDPAGYSTDENSIDATVLRYFLENKDD